ncbi:MAG: hypothetical protein ACHQ51_15435 [Elusimicrobiota bacterium]
MIKSLALYPILAAAALSGVSAGAQMTIRPVTALPSAPSAVSAAPLSGAALPSALTAAPALISAAPLAAPSVAPQAALPVAAPALAPVLAPASASLDRAASPKEAATARPLLETASAALRDERLGELFTGGRSHGATFAAPSADADGPTRRSGLASASRPGSEPAPVPRPNLTKKEFFVFNLAGLSAAIGIGMLTHSFWIGFLGTFAGTIPLLCLFVALRWLLR